MNRVATPTGALRRLHPLLPLAQAGAGLLVLVLTVRFVDASGVARLLSTLNPVAFALAVLAVQVQVVVSALRWRFTARRLGQHLPLGRAVAEYYLASLLNQILPGGVAGDAVRVLRSRHGGEGEDESRTGRALQAVVLERLSGQVVLLGAALGGVVLAPFVYGRSLPGGWPGLVAPGGLLLLILAGLAFSARRGRAAERLRALGPALAAVFLRRGAPILQIASSLVVVGGYLAAFALAGAAVGAPLDPVAVVLLVPLVLLSMLLPVSVGGWGVREGAAAAILPVAGLGADQAVAASLVYGLASLVGAAPGLLVVLRWGFRRSRRAEATA
ncbi:uncharacterized membrane protein YbhN (UPF0104 family) [Aureimonas jatrophae]|uniref:lysylphosphatidylglycerol synthase transmembrane domain-containing protein n=1 Tax=Aureimonas jatrophae TaxID=1166073 RepID=UPI001814E284|nr:lysylphosphatidylglycerol synthase transmembrane domain-containing protein [Aureimonas jatrophae]MBB3950038.1 uncharacterized membrane protein YbhN (UPF0104 family) [Aureimonas jatrophae]